jgi:hypothetical protein
MHFQREHIFMREHFLLSPPKRIYGWSNAAIE